jgi:hypothetical protein
MPETRTLTRAQLEEWGIPHELVSDGAPNPYGVAIELHREQTDTRRWYSLHLLVFRAPDDGQPWSVTYRNPLTEIQEGMDEWDDASEVTATRMEQYERTVTAWRPAGQEA